MLAVPVFETSSLGRVSKVHLTAPVRASSAKTVPGGSTEFGPVAAGPAEVERVAEDGGRLQDRQRPLGVGGVEVIDVEDAVRAEVGTGRAGVGVDGVQLGVHRADIDALVAGLAGDRALGLPVGDAAVLEVGLGQRLEHGMGVVGPLHAAGVGLDREDPVERRADIDGVVDEERRRRPDRRRGVGVHRRAAGLRVRVGPDVAGVDRPGAGQVADVVGGDLGQGRVLLRLEIAIEGRPGAVLGGGSAGEEGRGDGERERQASHRSVSVRHRNGG